jgi:hypothetical protein
VGAAAAVDGSGGAVPISDLDDVVEGFRCNVRDIVE